MMVASLPASTIIIHIVRDKVIVLMLVFLGSTIQVCNGIFDAWAYPVNIYSPLNRGAVLLEMDQLGNPLHDAAKLSLFRKYHILQLPIFPILPALATVYEVDEKLAEARVNEDLPEITVGSKTFEYYPLFRCAYDWRLRVEK